MNFSQVRQSPDWSLRCEQWLNQFSDTERAAAELLLDSVTYITHEDVCAGLQNAANQLITKLDGPCALYPITNTKAFGPFNSYDQLPFGINGDLGSEGDLGHLCRDLREIDKKRILAFPSLKTLREKKVRHIVLLTDSTSSGNQGIDYLDWMWSKTIRSWHSGDFIKFYYVSYLFTPKGRDRVKAHKACPSFHGLQACEPGHSMWTPQNWNDIEAICRKYGTQRSAMGYAGMMSLQVFSYSCPNNVPSILRYGSRPLGFKGLFERRPTNVCGHAIAGESKNLEAIATRLGIIPPSREAVICHALKSGPTSVENLSARLGLPLVSIKQGLREAVESGYIRYLKKTYKLTPNGVRFTRSLHRRSRADNTTTVDFSGRFDYIPQVRSSVISSSDASDLSEGPNG